MGLFSRKSDSVQPSAEVPFEFQRLSIREVLIFTAWGEGNIFVHCETAGKNIVKARVNESWYEQVVPSRIAGTKLMLEIQADWQSAHKSGLLPETVKFWSYGVKSFGFAPVDFSEVPEKLRPDYIFSLGRDLADKIEEGWFPQTDTDLDLLFNYFLVAPVRVGYFGPFKFILKTLTDAFPEHLGSMSTDFASHVAGTLAMGYGHVEGFLSHANRAPQALQEWPIDELRHLPELNGFKYPKIKTVQYLMRKGGRFLDYLEKETDALISTRFKIALLRGVDIAHQSSDLDEEKFLQYQQLTTRIIFRDYGLSFRDRESRKVDLGPRNLRHNMVIDKKFVSSLSSREIDVYKNWIAGLDGLHISVTLYALALSEAIPEIEFNWTQPIVRTLINSESEVAQVAVRDAINANPEFLRAVPSALVSEYLDKVDLQYLDKILEEIRSHANWSYQGTIDHWVSKKLEKKLDERELKIALFFILNSAGWILNIAWSDGLPKRNTLFLQIALQTKLQPFGQWSNYNGFDLWGDAQLLGFFGVAPHEKYPRGLFDVLDIRNKEMLEFFSKVVARVISYNGREEFALNILKAFYDSPKKGSNELVWTLLGGQSIPAGVQDAFLEHLNTADPSGTAYLRGIESAIEINDQRAILRHLTTLSAEAKETFWRRNKSEVETLLMTWKAFPTFFWSNIESIPIKVVERIRKYDGLNAKVLKQITPGSVARMSAAQIEYFVYMLKENPSICSNVSLLRAMLIAPSASINEVAAQYVKSENKYAAHWLLMLESNLPVTQQAGLAYLETQIEAKDFASKLLMALDSNNNGARRLALSLLTKVKSSTVLSSIVDGLVENRNTDTWKVVSKNLELISDVDKYKEFTSQVFLSRRKGRSVKEEIKFDIEELIEDISEAVEKDTLIRMAHSSVASDRDWAFKQIALTGLEIEGVTVEHTWKKDRHV